MIVHNSNKQTCEARVAPNAEKRSHIREENFRALLDLIRGAFGNREFKSQEFREVAALNLNNAQVYLVRLYEMGILFRRRVGCRYLYSLEKRWGDVRWRNKDKSALTDAQRQLIARAAARRAFALYGPGVGYGDLYASALVGAFKFHEIENKSVERPEAWQAVVVRNRAFSSACDYAERELRATQRRAKRFDPAWIGRRDKAAEEIEREKAAKFLCECVKDVAVEVGSEKEREVLNGMFEAFEPVCHPRERNAINSFVGKFALNVFELRDEDLAELVDDEESAAALLTSPGKIAKEEGKTKSAIWGRKYTARKNACAVVVNECLDGDRPLPYREFKNLRLWKQLEAAGL